jgi:peptidyl-prolyl cis-trans isomerase SurA
MKRFPIAWLLAAVVCLAAVSARGGQVDGVAAIVGDQVVLESEVSLASALLLDRLRRGDRPISSELREHARSEALNTLIDAKLILEFAERRDLAASPAEIDQAIAGIAQDEGLSVETVYQAAEQQGLAREDYREQLRYQITRMKVMQNIVRAHVELDDDEVKDLYEQRYSSQSPGIRVRARHILIPWADERTPETDARRREIAERIRQKAIESGAFASLARQFSRAPSAAEGGLTVFQEGEVAPQIAAEVFGLPAGEVSSVVETEHGLNLFQILDRFDPSKVSFEEVEEQLRLELTERKIEPEYERWVGELRKDHYVHVPGPR